jgi:hypothetical protein
LSVDEEGLQEHPQIGGQEQIVQEDGDHSALDPTRLHVQSMEAQKEKEFGEQ